MTESQRPNNQILVAQNAPSTHGGALSNIRTKVLVMAFGAIGLACSAATSCALERKGGCGDGCASAVAGNGGEAGNIGGQGGIAGEAGTGGHGGVAGFGGLGGAGGLDGGAGQGGIAGAGGLDGGAGQGGVAGNGGDAGAGGEAGAGGGGCTDIQVNLDNMAEYEIKAYQTNCAGPVMETSLGNANFETGLMELCLPAGHDYRMVVQVKDPADLNSVEIAAPQGSVSAVNVTTLVAENPIDNTTANLLCNASAGWTTLNPASDDKNPASGEYKFNGNTEGDAGLPNTNAFRVDLSL